MKTLHFSIIINAPRAKVWDTMLGDDTYRQWSQVFSPGSYFKGDWSEGSKMLFLGPDPKSGLEYGMVSQVAKNRLHDYISIEHRGIFNGGVEDTTSEEALKWAPAFENYTFVDRDGTTELLIDLDVAESEASNFEKMWPEALQKLKLITENSWATQLPYKQR